MRRRVETLKRLVAHLVRGARLAVGIPDYDAYCDHIRRAHPDRAPMDRRTFFRERMDARYGRGRSRCC